MLITTAHNRTKHASQTAFLMLNLLALLPFSSMATRTVSLAWDPSTGTNVAGYHVYYGVATGAYTNVVDAGAATNTTILGLEEDTTYFFAATAYDTSALESIFSNEINYTIPRITNTPPTLDSISSVAINENAGLQTVSLSGISSGATNEPQTLALTATSSNTGLIPNPTVTYTSPAATGSIAFTPVPYAFGSATITVRIDDGGGSNNIVTRLFSVTVNPVNQAPTLNALSNLKINANSGLQTVSLSGITAGPTNEPQTLTVTATSSNTGLIPNPTVTYTSPGASGSIAFIPVPDAYGSATITVTVNDGGTSNNIVSRSFSVTVNQAPTISAINNRVIAAGATTPALPFTIGDAETPLASLSLSATSSNPALVPNSNIVLGGSGSARTVTVTALAGQTGVATITITVGDGDATAISPFQITVRNKPAAPGNFHITQVLP